jgi:glycosyltransferase involved in cell wall biosynthesis
LHFALCFSKAVYLWNLINKNFMINLSIILPCYNEEEALEKTYQAILTEINNPKKMTEIGIKSMQINFVLVNDGSKDRTWEIIKNLKLTQEKSKSQKGIDIKIFGISLSRNFGKESALLSGLEMSPKSDYYLTLDADLQDDPKIIWNMLSKAIPKKSKKGLEENLENEASDIVYGQRSSRDDGFIYTFCTKIFYTIISGGKSQIPRNVADFYLINERVRKAFLRNSEKVRFTRGLIFNSGFRQTPVLYHRPPRQDGTTKWNYLKLTKFAVDAITSFGSFPLHFISFVGISGSIISFFGSVFYAIISVVFGFVKLEGWISLMLFISFFGSIQILFIGIVSEYIARIHTEVKNRPNYFVAETTFETIE